MSLLLIWIVRRIEESWKVFRIGSFWLVPHSLRLGATDCKRLNMVLVYAFRIESWSRWASDSPDVPQIGSDEVGVDVRLKKIEKFFPDEPRIEKDWKFSFDWCQFRLDLFGFTFKRTQGWEIIEKSIWMSLGFIRIGGWPPWKWMDLLCQHLSKICFIYSFSSVLQSNSYPGVLNPDYYQLFSDYIMKFFDGYKKYGLGFWSLSIGNEPQNTISANTHKMTMAWTPYGTAKFVGKNLGPSLNASEYKNTEILILDDTLDSVSFYVPIVMNHEDAIKFISGTAIHYHQRTVMTESSRDKIHTSYPDKYILMTEASQCKLLSGKKTTYY